MRKEEGYKALVENFKRARILIKNIKYGENIEQSMGELTVLLKENPLLITMTTKHRKNLLIKALEKSQGFPEALVNVYKSGLLKLLFSQGVNPLVKDQSGANALLTLKRNQCVSQTIYLDHVYASPDPSDPAVGYNNYLKGEYFPAYNNVLGLLNSSIKRIPGKISTLDGILSLRIVMSETTLNADVVGIMAGYLLIGAVENAGLSCAHESSERYFSIKKQGLFSSSAKSVDHLMGLASAKDIRGVSAKLDEIEKSSCETLKKALR